MEPSPPTLDSLLTAADVARHIGLRTTAGVRSLVSRGELPVAARGAHQRAFFVRPRRAPS